jgi:hypothetical protein
MLFKFDVQFGLMGNLHHFIWGIFKKKSHLVFYIRFLSYYFFFLKSIYRLEAGISTVYYNHRLYYTEETIKTFGQFKNQKSHNRKHV